MIISDLQYFLTQQPHPKILQIRDYMKSSVLYQILNSLLYMSVLLIKLF